MDHPVHPFERLAGTASVLVGLVGILLATWLDPTFSWTGDALSYLGVRERSAPVFNGSLVLAGVLGTVFGVGIARSAQSSGEKASGIVFAIASISLIGVGLFVTGHPFHLPTAIGFFLLATVVFLIDGTARRADARGRVTILFAVVHLLVWITWGAGWWPGDGLALPESAGTVLVGLWVWLTGPRPTLLEMVDVPRNQLSSD